jgi:hypothetical protein
MVSASSSFAGTENPLSEGGVWTQPSAYWQPMRKATGVAGVVTGNDGAMRYTGVTFSADHYSEMTLAAVPTGGQLYYQYVFARMNATAGCYLLTTASDVGAAMLQLWRISNAGVYTQIGTDITAPSNLAGGDVLRIECIGTTINIKRNGSLLRTATDSTFATGQPAIGGWFQNSGSNVVLISSWAAADIVAATGSPAPPSTRTPSYMLLL